MNTNSLEYTTWHDRKPSHNPIPDDLLVLQNAMRKAWLDYDALVEAQLDYWAGGNDEVTYEQIQEAQDYAVICQQAYWSAWYEANSDQCTCKPDDAIACDVCQAQIKSKSQYREEM